MDGGRQTGNAAGVVVIMREIGLGDHVGLERWGGEKWEVGRACGERGELGLSAPGACAERAGRRTPRAGRAVILPAVQSLRLLVRRGGPLRGPVLGCWEPGVPRVARGTPG